ncbi:glycosyltransferase family 4 protein [Streptomyces sp. MH13]|uniref:glycosyltransferase family 4 protein n=1 Tax=Streptomyces sp. MH13 TaxID=3417651 RepID=UPI003CF87683
MARVYGYPPDHNAGSEWMLHSMLRPLAERGHRVEVWLSHPGKSEKAYDIDGVRVVPFQQGLEFAARARTADVLVSHYENVPLVAGLARDGRIPIVVICHDNFEGSFHNAAGADLVLYNSHWIRRDGDVFYARYPQEFLPRRSIVVRPPVIAEEYRTQPGECVTLVNLNADKGGELFWQIAVWSPDWQFRGVRGAYGQQVMPPPRLPNCEVVDAVPGHRMREHVYARSRVVLMPSLYESWGRVAVEAFASGIPVIAHPTPGLVEALGQAGIFAYRDDTNAWIDALNSLRDPDTWERASRRARARSDELSASGDLELWCQAVEELGEARSGGASRGHTVAPAGATDGPASEGEDVPRAGSPAPGRHLRSAMKWMRGMFDNRRGPSRANGERRTERTGTIVPSASASVHTAARSDRSAEVTGEPARAAGTWDCAAQHRGAASDVVDLPGTDAMP